MFIRFEFGFTSSYYNIIHLFTIIFCFNVNPVTTIIGYYNLTNSSDQDTAINFYSDLLSRVEVVANHITLRGGDTNAKTGKANESTNSNVSLFLYMMNAIVLTLKKK